MTEPAIEIERTYLLDALPTLPAHAVSFIFEQAYLPEPETTPDGAVEGRVRRQTAPDGTVFCTHTIKRGHGIRRTEVEREIDEAEFETLWARTEGRRVLKTRHRIAVQASFGPASWEIDEFLDRDLILAEMELPAVYTEVEFPKWLDPHIVRDVTHEAGYSNYELATGKGAVPLRE